MEQLRAAQIIFVYYFVNHLCCRTVIICLLLMMCVCEACEAHAAHIAEAHLIYSSVDVVL